MVYSEEKMIRKFKYLQWLWTFRNSIECVDAHGHNLVFKPPKPSPLEGIVFGIKTVPNDQCGSARTVLSVSRLGVLVLCARTSRLATDQDTRIDRILFRNLTPFLRHWSFGINQRY